MNLITQMYNIYMNRDLILQLLMLLIGTFENTESMPVDLIAHFFHYKCTSLMFNY